VLSALVLLGGLAAAATTPTWNGSVALLGRHPIGERVVALAFIDDTRLLLLTPEEVLLYRSTEPAPAIVARLSLPGSRRPARVSAGLIVVDSDASAAWVTTNRCDHAALIEWNGERLAVRAEADALPWPGSETGLRYREGMDWLDGELPALGSGPFLAIESRGSRLAVAPDARVVLAGRSRERADAEPGGGTRVGPTLAPLWPESVAASTARPPGAGDALLVLTVDGAQVRVESALETEEAIRALASRPVGSAMRIAMATRDAEGHVRIAILDARRGER
jgi:hypothetical protein